MPRSSVFLQETSEGEEDLAQRKVTNSLSTVAHGRLAELPPPTRLHPAQTSAPLCQQESKSQKIVCPNSGTGLSEPGSRAGLTQSSIHGCGERSSQRPEISRPPPRQGEGWKPEQLSGT